MLGELSQPAEWLALLKFGGPVVVVLMVMSVVALAISLFKWLQLRPFSRRALDRLDEQVARWTRGDHPAAGKPTYRDDSMEALITHGMQWLALPGVDVTLVEAELTRMAQRILGRLGTLMGILEQVAYLAPLLGLLGTVLGIIDVFQGLAEQGSSADPGTLAGGIWEALLTTAVGLCVAIPFALVHAGLQGRIDLVRGRMEDMLTRLLTAGLYRGQPAIT